MISTFLTFERSWLRSNRHREDQNSIYVMLLMIFCNSHRMSDCRVLTCDLILLSRNAVVLVVYTMWWPVTQYVFTFLFVCFWRDSPQWIMDSSFTRFLHHIQRRTTIGKTPLDEWSARRRDLYLTNNTQNRKTSMPPVGFESTISAGERPHTYTLFEYLLMLITEWNSTKFIEKIYIICVCVCVCDYVSTEH
jgi:hypothetical protein